MIYENQVFDDSDEVYPYVPMSSVKLRQLFGQKKFYDILAEAKEHGIIRVKEGYFTGKQYKMYGLGANYKDKPITSHVLENKKLARIEPFKHNLRGTYLQLFRYAQMLEIREFSDTEIHEILDAIPQKKFRGKKRSKQEQFKRARIGLDKMVAKSFYGRKGTDNGRFYSNHTGIKREFRQYFRLGHENLISFDLSCSQPSLLSIKLIQEREVYYHHLGKKLKSTEFLRLKSTIETEIFCFHDECTTNKLYSHIATHLNITRDDAKVELLTYLFGEHEKRHVVAKYFRAKYPGLDTLFKFLKRRNHGVLAQILQKFESDIFIHKIAARIIAENPGLPFLTIHDSVMCAPKYKHIIYSIMYQELSKYIERPVIKEE